MMFNFNYKTHICFQLPSNLCKKAAFARITDLQIRVNFPNFWCDVSPVFLTSLGPLYLLDQLHRFLRSVFFFHFHCYQDFLFLDVSTMEEVIERIGKIQVECCEIFLTSIWQQMFIFYIFIDILYILSLCRMQYFQFDLNSVYYEITLVKNICFLLGWCHAWDFIKVTSFSDRDRASVAIFYTAIKLSKPLSYQVQYSRRIRITRICYLTAGEVLNLSSFKQMCNTSK